MGHPERVDSDRCAVDASVLNLLLFRLDRELYALPSSSVREIARYRNFTPVPGAPQALPGIISQRGAILPVVELRLLLGLPAAPLSRAARLVIAWSAEVEMALVVESVLDLLDLPADELEPPSAIPAPGHANPILRLLRYESEPVALLDPAALVAALREAS